MEIGASSSCFYPMETEKALNSIAFLGEKGSFLREFALYLLNREK